MDERRSDYTQELFDRFVDKVGVPRYAATMVGKGNKKFVVLTNDKKLFTYLRSECEVACVYDTLRKGYSALISSPNVNVMQLGEAISNAMYVEGKIWANKISGEEIFNAIFLADRPMALVSAADKVCDLHGVRAGKGYTSISCDDARSGIVSIDLALNNEKALNNRLSLYGDNNLSCFARTLNRALENAEEELV